ncbi:MAG: DedA family protein [Thermoplasmata archaeon]
MSVFVQIALIARDLVARAGYLGVFLAMVIEGVLTPIPSAVILPFAGLLASQGSFSLPLVIIIAASGATVGSLGAYAVGFKLGRPLLLKYGRFFRVEERHLDMADQWFQRYGTWAVLLGNSFTGFRSFISFPAGIARMSLRNFLPFTFMGALVWTTILVMAGFYLGDAALAFAETLEFFDPIVLGALAVFLLSFFVYKRRKSRLEALGEAGKP